jgi:hypothetical protein
VATHGKGQFQGNYITKEGKMGVHFKVEPGLGSGQCFGLALGLG